MFKWQSYSVFTIVTPVVNTSRSFPRSWVITGFVTRLTLRVSLVEQELPSLPEHLSSPPVFSGVHVTRSLVLYVCFVDRCLSFCTFSFGHCVVCSSSIYGLWLPPFGTCIFKLFLHCILGWSWSYSNWIYNYHPLFLYDSNHF